MRRTWLLALLLPVAGCSMDTSGPPEAAPLVVVVDDTGCTIGRDDLAAGVHEVVLATEGGPATIRVIDPTGSTLVESRVTGGDGATTSVQMDEGDYLVECEWPGGRTERVELTVVPARD